MKIHEYQAKQILRQFNLNVPEGGVAATPEEARKIAEDLAGPVVVKAQIHAGGRGKGGGIKLAEDPIQAERAAGEILGKRLITHQTGPEGKLVSKVLVEMSVDIKKELYAGIVLDRSRAQLVFMVSREGGVEIEKVARETPERIVREYIDPAMGIQPFQMRKLAYGLGLKGELVREASKFFRGLYRVYISKDCSLAEINPLVLTAENTLLALDAKINIDDNALFRQKTIAEMRDMAEEEPLEVEAKSYGLSYIKLEGNVGCMVNGAGLAMATMDIIKLAGGEPANFLDVGGAASAETVENGFRILMSDTNIKAVLINIFGGIVRCDRVARGVVQAAKKVEIDVPVVVRLEGTNAEEARHILNNSDIPFIVAGSLKEAAEKVVFSAVTSL